MLFLYHVYVILKLTVEKKRMTGAKILTKVANLQQWPAHCKVHSFTHYSQCFVLKYRVSNSILGEIEVMFIVCIIITNFRSRRNTGPVKKISFKLLII